MTAIGKMIRRMHATPLANVNLEYLARKLFDGEANLPHFEFLQESTDEGKLVHTKGYEIYVDPDYAASLEKLIDIRSGNVRGDRVEADMEFGRQALNLFEGTMRGDTAERAVTSIAGPATAQRGAQKLRSLKIGPGEKARIHDAFSKAANSAVQAAARKLKLDHPSYNTSLLVESFKNKFLYVSPEDLLLTGDAGITRQEKETIDRLLIDFFKDKSNHPALRSHSGLMGHLDNLIIRKQGEDEDVYFARIATPPHAGIFAPVVSPFIAQMLFNTMDFPKFAEMFGERTKLANGKVEALKRKYEGFLNDIYRAAIVDLIKRKIIFLDRPGQINLGKYLFSPLNITSPIIGFDIIRSTAVVEALGDFAPDLLNAYKIDIGAPFEAHPTDGEYVNDMGDGAFDVASGVKQLVIAAHEGLPRSRLPETKNRVIDNAFTAEINAVNAGAELAAEKAMEHAQRAEGMNTQDDRISRMLTDAESRKYSERASLAEKLGMPLEEAKRKAYELFPAVRFTIVYNSYKMRKVENSTATGRAAWRVNRALGSDGGQPETFSIELKDVGGVTKVCHEGVLLLREPVEILKRELGPGSFVTNDLTNRLGEAYRAKTGNKEATVYAPKGLESKGTQIYLAYLGKGNIRGYPNEDIWSVLTEEDIEKLGGRPQISVPPVNPLIPSPPPLEPGFRITRDPYGGMFGDDK